MKKITMYIITLLSTYILVSMLYTIYSNKQWNEDHKCEIILSGGLKEYNQLLDYNKYVTFPRPQIAFSLVPKLHLGMHTRVITTKTINTKQAIISNGKK